jgi:tetratricopeptide (TPR) repeat protein
MRYGIIAPVVCVAALSAADVAFAQDLDPRALKQDLRDREARLWDEFQHAISGKTVFGRFKRRDDDSLWTDDKGQYQFDVDLNHPQMKNSVGRLRLKKSDVTEAKFRQLHGECAWKEFQARFPKPQKPDRAAIAGIADTAVAQAAEEYEFFVDEVRKGLLDTAARIYEAAIAIGGEWPVGYVKLGDLYRQRFDYERELATYLAAAKANSADGEVLRRHAEALERLGLRQESENVFTKSIDASVDNGKQLVGRGRVRLRLGRPEDALADFTAASKGTEAGVAWQGIGRARLQLAKNLKDLAAAVEALRKGRELASEGARGLDGGPLKQELSNDLAVALILDANYDEAIEALKEVLELDADPEPPAPAVPGNPDDPPPAEPEPAGPRLALEFNPFKATAYVNLGLAYVQKDYVTAAQESFDRAAALDPTSAAPLVGLGALAERISAAAVATESKEDDADIQWGVAADRYTAALAIDPTHAGARYALAQLLFRGGKLEDAQRELEETIRLDPNQADALALLGHIALEQTRDVAAARYFARALEFLPDDATLHASRGVALLRAGEVEAAEQELRAAQKLDAQNLTAKEASAYIDYVRARGKRDREERALAKMRLIASDSPWATAAREAVRTQRAKHQWSDDFGRRNSTTVGNKWEHKLKNGPTVAIADQKAVFSKAVQRAPDKASVELVRETDAGDFVSIEARFFVEASLAADVRLTLVKRTRSDEASQAVFIGKSRTGELVIGKFDSSKKLWVTTQTLGPWPAAAEGGAVTLHIEKLVKNGRPQNEFSFRVNGEIVAADVGGLFTGGRDVWAGISAQADLDVAVKFAVDDVILVERR